MPETARFAYYGPIPWLVLGAVIGIALIGAHGIGAIILLVLAVGFVAKRMYRWQAAANGEPVAWPSCAGRWGRWRDRRPAEPMPSGNSAFDDYRREMLRRLEQDHQDFQAFLERLRKAKDKAEFDQFMAERDRRAQEPPAEGPQPSWPRP